MTAPKSLALLLALALAACGGGSSNDNNNNNNNDNLPSAGPTRAAGATTDWWNGAVVYEIFTRSFRDSNGDGNGDLAGIKEKLPYLQELGVDAIWLTPIYPSPSYHGYDVTSYEDVNPEFDPRWASGKGSQSTDFDELVAAAHAAGIKVVLDFVPNHSSSQHPWFVDARSSTTATYRDYYVWSATNPGWGQPWGGGSTWYSATGGYYYGAFNADMPDLNWTNPALRTAIEDAAVGWLNRGVDGFRLDAVRYLVETGGGAGQRDQPETHDVLKEFTAAVRAAAPQALVLGEAWTDTAAQMISYFGDASSQAAGGDETLPLDFFFGYTAVGAVQYGNASALRAGLDAVATSYPAGSGYAPFLTNHDQERLASTLNGDLPSLKLTATLLLTQQGTPIIYYGEELGSQNSTASGDLHKRAPMAWDATSTRGFSAGAPWNSFWPDSGHVNVASEDADPGSLLSRYKALIALRKQSTALRLGDTTRVGTTGTLVAAVRTSGAERVLVAANLGTAELTQTVALEGSTATALLTDGGATATAGASGQWTLTLPARGSGIWRLE